MIKLSRLADYGVLLMCQVARKPDAVANAQDLVSASGLPAATVSKLLATLARHELLVSIRGSKGGYRLARSATGISVEQIIAAVDGPIAVTMCVDEDGECCGVASFCTTQGYWQRINGAIKEALDNVSLADIATAVPMFEEPEEPAPRHKDESRADAIRVPGG